MGPIGIMAHPANKIEPATAVASSRLLVFRSVLISALHSWVAAAQARSMRRGRLEGEPASTASSTSRRRGNTPSGPCSNTSRPSIAIAASALRRPAARTAHTRGPDSNKGTSSTDMRSRDTRNSDIRTDTGNHTHRAKTSPNMEPRRRTRHSPAIHRRAIHRRAIGRRAIRHRLCAKRHRLQRVGRHVVNRQVVNRQVVPREASRRHRPLAVRHHLPHRGPAPLLPRLRGRAPQSRRTRSSAASWKPPFLYPVFQSSPRRAPSPWTRLAYAPGNSTARNRLDRRRADWIPDILPPQEATRLDEDQAAREPRCPPRVNTTGPGPLASAMRSYLPIGQHSAMGAAPFTLGRRRNPDRRLRAQRVGAGTVDRDQFGQAATGPPSLQRARWSWAFALFADALGGWQTADSPGEVHGSYGSGHPLRQLPHERRTCGGMSTPGEVIDGVFR